jgi:hypothetical protein
VIDPKHFTAVCEEQGVSLFTGVPDSLPKQRIKDTQVYASIDGSVPTPPTSPPTAPDPGDDHDHHHPEPEPDPTPDPDPGPSPTPDEVQGDLNGDGRVNILDLSILLSNWNRTTGNLTNPKADLNGDGKVDILDLSILLSRWGN